MNDNTKLCSAEYETKRLQALADYQILDTPEESAFDEIVEVISLICEAPIAVINFIDRDRQWFKSEKGLGVRETPLDISLCAHAILQPGLFIVHDTTKDSRFANNPLVVGEPHLRFYAGALLESREGYPLGTLCVLDYRPRELTERQRFALQALANQVMAHMELMQAHRAQAELIRELKATRQELAKRASTDPLTGLGNRRYLQDQAAMEMARAKRNGEPLSLIAIDLDNFKRINDEYGHDVGDSVLQGFARTAKELLREGDVLCRMGGEEFAILLPATSRSQAMQVAERLRQVLEASPVSVCHDVTEDGWLPYTASLGVTLVIAEEPSLKPAIKRADLGLYAAKEAGRNRVHWQAL